MPMLSSASSAQGELWEKQRKKPRSNPMKVSGWSVFLFTSGVKGWHGRRLDQMYLISHGWHYQPPKPSLSHQNMLLSLLKDVWQPQSDHVVHSYSPCMGPLGLQAHLARSPISTPCLLPSAWPRTALPTMLVPPVPDSTRVPPPLAPRAHVTCSLSSMEATCPQWLWAAGIRLVQVERRFKCKNPLDFKERVLENKPKKVTYLNNVLCWL